MCISVISFLTGPLVADGVTILIDDVDVEEGKLDFCELSRLCCDSISSKRQNSSSMQAKWIVCEGREASDSCEKEGRYPR